MRKWIFAALIVIIALLVLPFLWREALVRYYEPRIHTVETAEEAPVAIVFGARVYDSGRLSGMLRDRVESAVALYEAGKVDRILMSGGVNGSVSEPAAMRDYAVWRGVPAEAILVDEAGLRTYDTCYWAHTHFGIEQATLITQRFHLPRAHFTCSALGIESQAVTADQRGYHPMSVRWSEMREVPATTIALLDVIRRERPQ